jgi:hypothetical protein
VSLHVQKNSGTYELIQIQNNSAGALLRAIGLGGGSADFGADDTAASTAVIRTAGTERMRITSDGFARLSASSGGIQFNGDTAAANALDDYEEGTWTPAISFGGGTTGITYDRNGGSYTKVGRQVTVCGDIILTSKGSSTGNATLTGLPFTINGSSTNFLCVASFRLANVSFITQFQGYGGPGTTTINFEEALSGLGASTLNNTDFANDSQIMVSLTYYI